MTKLVLVLDDVKSLAAIDFVSGFDVLEPFILDNENWLTRRYIGTALLSKLALVRTPAEIGDAPSDLYKNLLLIAQGIVINRSLMQYIPEGQLDISENGIRISTSETKKTAFPWQIEKLERRYLDASNEKIEQLLELLFENDITEWKDSDIAKRIRGNFVNSAKQFDLYFSINESHRTFLSLASDISYIERVYLKTILGEAFFLELRDKVAKGEDKLPQSPTDADKKYLTLIDLVRAAVVLLTANYAGSSLQRTDDIDQRATHAQQQLKEFLNTNASAQLFTTYFNSNKYTSPTTVITDGIDNSNLSGIFGAL